MPQSVHFAVTVPMAFVVSVAVFAFLITGYAALQQLARRYELTGLRARIERLDPHPPAGEMRRYLLEDAYTGYDSAAEVEQYMSSQDDETENFLAWLRELSQADAA